MNRLAKTCVVFTAGVVLASATSPSVNAEPQSPSEDTFLERLEKRYPRTTSTLSIEDILKKALPPDSRPQQPNADSRPSAPRAPGAPVTTDGIPPRAPDPPVTTHAIPPPATPTPRAGVISGRITDSRGNPLQKARVRIHGPSMAGQELEFSPRPDANGEYSVAVPPGNYKVEALVEPVYERRTWRLPLHPTDDDCNEVSPEAGIRKDFRWRLSGLVPCGIPENPFSYYGEHVTVDVAPDHRHLFDGLPRGSMVRFTLTPTGPLIDGSRGRPLVFDRAPDAIGRTEGHIDDTWNLHDIPIGPYDIVATMRTPDGNVFPVSLSVVPVSGTSRAHLEFGPDMAFGSTIPSVTVAASWRLGR